jgi:hypothetical protein
MTPESERGNLRSELGVLMPTVSRMVVCATYFVVSYLLLSINTYGLGHIVRISFIVAILACGSSSAWLARLAIAILIIMAVIPYDALKTIVGLFRISVNSIS